MVLQKALLMYNKNKVYIINKEKFVKEITSHKYDCFFDVVALIIDNVWVLQIREVRYNYKFMLFGIHLTYQKVVKT